MREQRRLQRKKMRFLFLSLLMIIILIAIIGFMLPSKIEASEPIQVVTVQVEAGDSLWKLADKYDNNSMDLRQYIYIIQRFNKLENTVLLPGQKIMIPVYESEQRTIALTSSLIK